MSYKDQLNEKGYCLIRSESDRRTAKASFEMIGLIEQLNGFAEIQILKPTKTEMAGPNSYSGNYGIDVFPFHTDLAHWAIPPRYFALRCVIGHAEVTTNIIDSKHIIKLVGESKLLSTLVRPRRPLNGGYSLLSLLNSRKNGNTIFRWDKLFLKPVSDYSRNSFQEVEEAICEQSISNVSLESPGDILVIDNWRMIHGRSNVSKESLSRIIERAYIRRLH